MLYLRTGLPGASKTLNTLKEIIEDTNLVGRPIYYNNIKLLMLDIDVCSSFSGWFYGVYFGSVDKDKKRPLTKRLLKIHQEGELASPDTFPHLVQLFEAWLSFNGHVQLWLDWVNKLYPSARRSELDLFLSACEPDQITIENLMQFNLHWAHFKDPTLWYQLPRNSVIVVDECQQTFPPRPVGAKVPLHCSEFETHRHKGFDIHLVTQDAKLLDNHVRRLAGRHIHFFNPFSSSRITRYQADKVFDPDDYFAKKATIKSTPKRDSKFYGLYWSADVHTHKSIIPKKVFLLLLLPMLVAYLVYLAVTGAWISSPKLPAGSVSSGSSGSSVVTQSISGTSTSKPVQAFVSDGVSIRPFNSLVSDTPLSSLCKSVTYAGYEIKKSRSGITRLNHYFTCDLPVEDLERKSDKQAHEVPDSPPQIVLDGSFMETLGFTFEFSDGLPTLLFGKNKYIFPRY